MLKTLVKKNDSLEVGGKWLMLDEKPSEAQYFRILSMLKATVWDNTVNFLIRDSLGQRKVGRGWPLTAAEIYAMNKLEKLFWRLEWDCRAFARKMNKRRGSQHQHWSCELGRYVDDGE